MFFITFILYIYIYIFIYLFIYLIIIFMAMQYRICGCATKSARREARRFRGRGYVRGRAARLDSIIVLNMPPRQRLSQLAPHWHQPGPKGAEGPSGKTLTVQFKREKNTKLTKS